MGKPESKDLFFQAKAHRNGVGAGAKEGRVGKGWVMRFIKILDQEIWVPNHLAWQRHLKLDLSKTIAATALLQEGVSRRERSFQKGIRILGHWSKGSVLYRQRPKARLPKNR